MILLDSNIVIDLMGSDASWRVWSSNAVASAQDDLAISPIVVAEVAPRLGSLDDFLERLARFGAIVSEFGNEAAYAAGTAFTVYRERRRQSGQTSSYVLPDFLIGGHAQVIAATILTRDPRFYRNYFPTVPLITPETDPA